MEITPIQIVPIKELHSGNGHITKAVVVHERRCRCARNQYGQAF